jgi:hypothetical protein
MSRNLAIKDELLTEQRRENDRLLRSLMPEPVVQRYREGEQTIAQDHQNVTVIFADIAGLDELSSELDSEHMLEIVNKLVRQSTRRQRISASNRCARYTTAIWPAAGCPCRGWTTSAARSISRSKCIASSTGSTPSPGTT